MSRLRVVICRVEEEGESEQTTEVARFDLAETDLAAAAPGTGLDVLEAATHQTGQAILRRVLQAQWEAADAAAVAAHRRAFPPSDVGVRRDG
jgi:hypothetical protein